MSQIMKAYLAVFLLLTMLFTSGAIFTAYIGVANAQDFYSSFIDELEVGNFQPAIIREGMNRASQYGYQMEIQLFQEQGGVYYCNSAASVPGSTSDTELARVQMSFPLHIGILGMQQTHTLCGYAR